MDMHKIRKIISDAFDRDRGFREGKHELCKGKNCLGICPKCGMKNNIKFVLTGVCAWCAYDINTNCYLEEE